MSTPISPFRLVLDNPWRFAWRVLAGFRANQGLLLAGAVAYYTLLSIVPMLALILVLLSHVQEQQALLDALRDYLVLIAPGQADALIAQVSVFMENRKVIGWVGLLIGGVSLAGLGWASSSGAENWQTVVFTVLVLAQLGHSLAVRSETAPSFGRRFFSNPALLGAAQALRASGGRHHHHPQRGYTGSRVTVHRTVASVTGRPK